MGGIYTIFEVGTLHLKINLIKIIKINIYKY